MWKGSTKKKNLETENFLNLIEKLIYPDWLSIDIRNTAIFLRGNSQTFQQILSVVLHFLTVILTFNAL